MLQSPKEVTVTNTVGEYRKLAQAEDNPGEHHVYQDSPEPESIKAACMSLQVLEPSLSLNQPLNLSPQRNHQQRITLEVGRAFSIPQNLSHGLEKLQTTTLS